MIHRSAIDRLGWSDMSSEGVRQASRWAAQAGVTPMAQTDAIAYRGGEESPKPCRRLLGQRSLAANACVTRGPTRPLMSPPKRATSLINELDTCVYDGSPGRKRVSTPVR